MGPSGGRVYKLSEEELADIKAAIEEYERGEIASDEEVAAVFNKYRRAGRASMTKLLEQGIEAIRRLPEERQDIAGELLLAIADEGAAKYRLTPEQIEEVRLAMEEAERGEFATDEEMDELWKKCGL